MGIVPGSSDKKPKFLACPTTVEGMGLIEKIQDETPKDWQLQTEMGFNNEGKCAMILTGIRGGFKEEFREEAGHRIRTVTPNQKNAAVFFVYVEDEGEKIRLLYGHYGEPKSRFNRAYSKDLHQVAYGVLTDFIKEEAR